MPGPAPSRPPAPPPKRVFKYESSDCHAAIEMSQICGLRVDGPRLDLYLRGGGSLNVHFANDAEAKQAFDTSAEMLWGRV